MALDDMRASTDWMAELAMHYEQMRRAYPDDVLAIVFDIDGTILDMRYLMVHTLLAFDRVHGTDYFRGLGVEDVDVHETRIEELLFARRHPAPVRAEVVSWYADHIWSSEAVLAGSRPYAGVLGVIRWFQLQPRTIVALNTGRPEPLRELTLQSLNDVGRAYRVSFDSEHLWMNPRGWGEDIPQSKVEGMDRLQRAGLRVVAVVDNEPANLAAMAASDTTGEILFLHAETIFESQRAHLPRSVTGSSYALAGLVREEDIRDRVEFVWHGVNDEANLRQFLSSDVRWAECDVRLDPLDRLVLRHDSFEETSWTRTEHAFLLEECLRALARHGRAAALDLKDPRAVERTLDAVQASGLPAADVAFLGCIDDVGVDGFGAIHQRFPEAQVAVQVGFLAPLLTAAPSLADHVLTELRRWGATAVSLAWTTPCIRTLLDELESHGWDVYVFGVEDLESFLDASLLLPRAVIADFNFPDWHYYGRGSGQRRAYHRYELVRETRRETV
ncbi:MAG: HAD family hydrolase [Actinomycetota bacterium]|nr:HAD family hydrolase [Actinomycetota bacterium]